jgi:nuclear pore complex protein Nup160
MHIVLRKHTQEHHPEYLIRACLRYELYEEALEYTLRLVREVCALMFSCMLRGDPYSSIQSSKSWDLASSIRPSKTWLPYNLIDSVLKITNEHSVPSVHRLQSTLQSELTLHMNRLKKHSERSR